MKQDRKAGKQQQGCSPSNNLQMESGYPEYGSLHRVPGCFAVQPNPQERMAMNEQHFQPTLNQFSHQQTASLDRSQWASANGGRPATTAMNQVNGARFNQQGRIAQGIESDQLNARQAGRLENQEARTNQEIHQGSAGPWPHAHSAGETTSETATGKDEPTYSQPKA